MKISYKITFLFFFFFCTLLGFGQKDNIPVSSPAPLATTDSSLKLQVQKISISGNKKTKTYIIEREMPFRQGDSLVIASLTDKMEQARSLIYNTTLFNEVTITAIPVDAHNITVQVDVKERWYVFPVPQFKWVDRNFNEWLKTYGGSLSRVNYGLKFVHYNLTGRKDQLRIFLLNGYSRNISMSYNAPYSNSSLTEGFSVSAGYSQARQMAYKTDKNNRRLFFPNDSVPRELGVFVNAAFNATANYQIRRGYYNKESYGINYSLQKVNDTILKLNPAFFNSPGTRQSIIDFAYSYQHTNVDNSGYTLKGVSSYINILKRGFAFSKKTDMLSVEAGYSQYHDLGKNWYGSYNLFAKLILPFDQPYVNQNALGYGNAFLRGLDEYVVDGVAAGLIRTTLRKKIISFKLPLPFKSKSHPNIPFTFFAKTFADAGYVYNKKQFDTYFNNRLIYTGGFGLDILMLYDVNLRFEYSFNQLGQNGLFLHTQSGF